MVQQIRILVADNRLRARLSLQALLATLPQHVELRQAENGRQALQVAGEFHPDLVLMDVRMPEMDGIQATRIIKAQYPQIRVIVLSMYLDMRADALAAGADAFVSKGDPPEKLLSTIGTVLNCKC